MNRGTTFTIYLPRVAQEVEVEGYVCHEVEPLGGKETVLVVEDDDSVRAFTTEFLTRLGYHVLTAANGLEGLRVCRNREESIDLILSDVVMPGMNGPEFIEQAQVLRDDFAVLFISGYPDRDSTDRDILQSGYLLLHKPLDVSKFPQQIRRALSGE